MPSLSHCMRRLSLGSSGVHDDDDDTAPRKECNNSNRYDKNDDDDDDQNDELDDNDDSNVIYASQDEEEEETPEFIEASLKALQAALDEIDDSLKVAWNMAQEHCDPSLIDAQHQLMFLRCESFYAELAALRLVRYWSKRVDLFGTDKAFLPMTRRGALRDDGAALSLGAIYWIPGAHDVQGRAIIFDYVSNARSREMQRRIKFVRQTSVVRAFWYVLHVALQHDPRGLCTRGAVLLNDMSSHYDVLRDSDLGQYRSIFDTLSCVPLRHHAYHICRCSLLIRFILQFVVRPYWMGPLLNETPIYYHGGSPSAVLRQLEQHGIPPSSVPAEMGGTSEFDYATWLESQI